MEPTTNRTPKPETVQGHRSVECDMCGETVSAERLGRYARNPNHYCQADRHYCSDGCYRSDGDNGLGL